jgi:hypothetical protein
MTDHSTQDIETVIRMVVERFTCEGFLFTALDVSNRVKQELPGVRHREVAPIVRDLYQDGDFGSDYTRSTIKVTLQNGSTTEALLYHLDDDEPDDYAGTQRAQVAIPPLPVSSFGPVTPAVTSNTATLEVGRDGRARLDRSFIQQAGIAGDEVLVSLKDSGPALLLHHPSTNPGPVLARLQYTHPTLLHVPISLLTAFDLSQPLLARQDSQGLVVEGTPSSG